MTQIQQIAKIKSRPILFSTPMVLKLLVGEKTQTRRIVNGLRDKNLPITLEPWIIDGIQETDNWGSPCWLGTHPEYPSVSKWFSCDYGKIGDRLWVRETWRKLDRQCAVQGQIKEAGDYSYKSEYQSDDWNLYKWKPSIFMPKEASRITLEITNVKVERVGDCSEEDAIAEGFANSKEFLSYFYKLNPNYLNQSPWCWCVSFKVT